MCCHVGSNLLKISPFYNAKKKFRATLIGCNTEFNTLKCDIVFLGCGWYVVLHHLIVSLTLIWYNEENVLFNLNLFSQFKCVYVAILAFYFYNDNVQNYLWIIYNLFMKRFRGWPARQGTSRPKVNETNIPSILFSCWGPNNAVLCMCLC